jgi:hypothetical protein
MKSQSWLISGAGPTQAMVWHGRGRITCSGGRRGTEPLSSLSWAESERGFRERARRIGPSLLSGATADPRNARLELPPNARAGLPHRDPSSVLLSLAGDR